MSRVLAAFRAGIREIGMGGEGGIVRGCAAYPSLTLGAAVALASSGVLRRPGGWARTSGSNPALFLANENKKGPEVPFYFHIGGEGGIDPGHPGPRPSGAVAGALRRPAPPLSRRLVEPNGTNTAGAYYVAAQKS